MKKITKLLTMLLTLAVLVGAMTLTAAAAEFRAEDAFTYLDGYADHVGVDENFDENIDAALAAARESVSSYGTLMALLPPVIAIALALLTKEVYSSLFVGILAGSLIYTNWNPWNMVLNSFDVMISKICDSWNVGILIFLVLLGMMVSMINKAGGSAAYGRWAASRIKNKSGALISTSVLGMLIFIDDYFNCLTEPTVRQLK